MASEWWVIDDENNVVVKRGWEWCMFANEQLLYYRQNGEEGLFDWRDEKTVLKTNALTIHGLEDSALVAGNTGDWHLIDLYGRRINKDTFWHVRSFVDGLAAASRREGGPYGFINPAGEWVIRPQFHHVTDFSQGLSAAMDDSGREFYIDRHGDTVIPGPFSRANQFSEGLARVRIGTSDFYINKAGQTVIPSSDEWSAGGSFYCGRANVLSRRHLEKVFFIDKAGKMVGNNFFDESSAFSEGVAAVASNRKWGAIDLSGNLILPYSLDALDSHSCGKSAAQLEGKYGYVDVNGHWVIRPQYDIAGEFSPKNQLACVAVF